MVSEGQAVLGVVGTVFTFCGAIMLVLQHRIGRAAERAESWETVTAHIKDTDVDGYYDGDWEFYDGDEDLHDTNHYALNIEYQYEYEGEKHLNDTVYPGSIPDHEGNKSAMAAFMEKHQPGDEVEAFVNPDDPEEAALKIPNGRRLLLSRVLLVGMGGLFGLSGLGALAELLTLLG